MPIINNLENKTKVFKQTVNKLTNSFCLFDHKLLTIHVVSETIIIDSKVKKNKQTIVVGKVNDKTLELHKDELVLEKNKIGFPCLVEKSFANKWLYNNAYNCLDNSVLSNPYSIIESVTEKGEIWSEQYLLVFINFGSELAFVLNDEVLSEAKVLTKDCFKLLPNRINFEYINSRVDNENYDLEKLSIYLRSNPDKFKIDGDENRTLYLRDKETGIGAIPYYNATEEKYKSICFCLYPTEEEFVDFIENYKSDRRKYADALFKEFAIKKHFEE